MKGRELRVTARKLVAPKKGILAADESSGTIEKRFAAIKLASTEKSRYAWRYLLFSTKGMEKFISGVILYDETLRQGLGKVLQKKGVIPGIKVDKGAKEMALFPGEVVTEGLDGLRERLVEYVDLGAKFAKWRAVITIGKRIPTMECIEANVHALARYAALCQEVGLVPVVEPEVLMDGDHTISKCEQVTELTLKAVFRELKKYRIDLVGMLLKPNMVVSGSECKTQAGSRQVAKATVRLFRKVVPRQVPGCVFLSGGQSPDEATEILHEMNKLGKQPWELSFSYGRALQQEALHAWRGKPAHVKAAQQAFYERAKKVSLAREGKLW
ncbi:MAG: fructose-bisphosphate aldolase class I [Candidatus Chisholmbacteria bacterium]|nr:fructose-bisphosphate aldolase class I [Candidatus Chisholmbacteria bacterium]